MENEVKNTVLEELKDEKTETGTEYAVIPEDERIVVLDDDTQAEPKKKRKLFKTSLIVYSCILLILSITALTFLWIFLDSYQQSDTQAAAENALSGISEDRWMKYLEENVYISSFEDREAAIRLAYAHYFEGKDLNCHRKAAECDSNTEVFGVSNGKRTVCKLLLKKKGTGAFDFDRWEFDKIAPTDNPLDEQNEEITVLLPANGRLYINGITADLSESKVADCPYDLPGDAEPDYVLYSFKKPWGSYELEAYGQNENQKLTLDEKGPADFVFDITERIGYKIVVPAGSELYINGERLSTDYITESNVKYHGISPLEEHLENAPKDTVYEIKGLYEEPEIKAQYNGVTMSWVYDNGVYSFGLPYEFKEYEVLVPNDATVKINGIIIGEEYVAEASTVYTEVAEYSELLINAKTLCRYKVTGLLFKPQIEVSDSFGTPCTLTQVSGNTYCCDAAPSPALIEKYDAFTKDFAVAMVEYSMEGKEKVAENYAEVLAFTGFDSNAYNVITDAYMGMYWQMSHNITFNSLYTDNYVSYADNAFTCDIHFDVVGERIHFPGRTDYSSGIYKVLCVETGGTIKIMELSIETPSDSSNNEE